MFEERVSWPPTSLDLNPCDYFLWGLLKDSVSENEQTITGLKIPIQSETETT
jgi:hypothetical protein